MCLNVEEKVRIFIFRKGRQAHEVRRLEWLPQVSLDPGLVLALLQRLRLFGVLFGLHGLAGAEGEILVTEQEIQQGKHL